MNHPLVVHAVGDSHTQYFSPKSPRRMKLPAPLPFQVKANVVFGASLTGLRAKASTLKMRSLIDETIQSAKYLVLNFGQVDLEIGYYFKKVNKKENWTPETYVDYLIEIYGQFLSDVDLGDTQLAIKGVNLTVMTVRPFAMRYTGRIINDSELAGSMNKREAAEAKKLLGDVLLNEREQNDLHLAFNQRLSKLCSEFKADYFDINDYLSTKTKRGKIIEPMTLSEEFQPVHFDHHVVPSIGIHREHYFKLGRVFGLIE